MRERKLEVDESPFIIYTISITVQVESLIICAQLKSICSYLTNINVHEDKFHYSNFYKHIYYDYIICLDLMEIIMVLKYRTPIKHNELRLLSSLHMGT